MVKKQKATCCSVEGCQGKGVISSVGKEHFPLGYCVKHYTAFKAHGDPLHKLQRTTCCSIEGCESEGQINKKGVKCFKLGYCNKHYLRLKRHGDPLYVALNVSATCCSVDGCKGKGIIKSNRAEVFPLGYCNKHHKRFRTHGDSLIVKQIYGEDRHKNPLYIIYAAIKQRCYDKNCKNYKNYGGRGIIMSDEWLGLRGFDQFILDMGERPEGHSIDRINVNGNYCKENCRWANRHQQQANTRTNNKKVGVSWNKKSKKWSAQIVIKKETIRLGNFVNYDEACTARRNAEIFHDVYNEKK